ncbi:MAG: deoxyhypusine synthase [archaeon]
MDKIRDISIEDDLIDNLYTTGFQATNLAEAIDIIERMKKENCKIFFGFTANLVASGLRGLVKDLCRKKFIDAIVTTAGSIDHDIIKSYKPYLQGSFFVDDAKLHEKGINRLGNIFIPTDRFILLEKKIQPIFSRIYKEQKICSPSFLNKRIGETLNKSSFLYWCAKNDIPVFCPGITDGAIGLQMYFFKQGHKDFGIDVTKDMKDLADLVLNADKTAAIILGGGISKHHIIGANIVRDGLDYAVYISTAQEFDGSLSGAQTREAKSWGKIKEKAKSVTVNADATIAFPLVVSALNKKKLI